MVAIICFVIGLPLVWIKGQSQFQAEAVFQVYPYFQKNLKLDKDMELQSNSQYREFVNHLSRSVLRYDIVEESLRRLKRDKVNPCLPPETERKCIERLQRTIYIIAILDTYMVRVGMNDSEGADLHKLINTLTQTFIETVQEEQIFAADGRAKTLLARKKALGQEVAQFEKERASLASELGLTTFSEHVVNPYDTILAQAREKLNLASIDRAQAQAMLDAYLAKRETPAQAGRSVLELRQQDTALQALRNESVKRVEDLNHAMEGLDPSHPGYQPAQKERSAIHQRLQSKEEAVEAQARQNMMARLTASTMQTQQVEQELMQRVASLEAQATHFAESFRLAVRLTNDIKKREQESDEIRDRLNYLGSEKEALGFVRLVTPAMPALTPQGVGRTKLALALVAACLAIALAVPILMDMLDGRVLTVGDAERAMGVQAAAWLVDNENEATQTLLQDQVLRLASTLMRNKARGASGVFALSSVKLGGGTSSVVRHVAETLTRLGHATLVVDANAMTLRSPWLKGEPGLTDHLANGGDADEHIQKLATEGGDLSILPFGLAKEGGVVRLDRLQSALLDWQQRFEFILFDTAPLLLSADAELITDSVQQVFVVVEAGNATKGDVSRMASLLRKIKPEAVGLIVNRLPMAVAGHVVKKEMVEAITQERYQRVMSRPYIRLKWALWRVQLQRWWRDQ
jgi:Mrp family chromosome partitioning ATPase